MELPSLLSITPFYIAVLGILFIPFTLRVGLYRAKTNILIGTGDDPEMVRRTRGQANFIETVPIALFLLVMMEILGASDTWLNALGVALVLSRLFHYLSLTEIGPFGPFAIRLASMMATLATILVSSIWILVDVFK